ncbi:MAG TPA: N-methyl-L-tryptophan oxidase [Xanthobacteraceae bacterium]|nr:N-methyl-L-tryptophan oxidase [Xanthobacteraceae bacterium]
MTRYDAIVIGLGAFGSAAAYHLAKAGSRVLAIDRDFPPHKLGSSHGETRVTRSAIGEGAEYVQLALRSNALWRELEAQSGERLFVPCGCLLISGRPDAPQTHGVNDFFDRTRAAAEQHAIALHELATGSAIRARYPQFAVIEAEKALLDPTGGLLFPAQCISAQLALAETCGATLRKGRAVTSYREERDGVAVSTDDGEVHVADRLLITAGAWAPRLIGGALQAHAKVTRQVVHWFEITGEPARFDPAVCPAFIWQVDRPSVLYGFPHHGGAATGVKFGHEEDHGAVDPDTVSREVSQAEVDYTYRTYVRPFFPDLGPRSLRNEVCLYTRVEKARFVIDWLPRSARILFASPCSGHGFKHSAAVGEALAETLMTGAAVRVDLSYFSLDALQQFVA